MLRVYLFYVERQKQNSRCPVIYLIETVKQKWEEFIDMYAVT